jgi:hypothetical protein
LHGNDALCDPEQFLIVAVAQLSLRHVDCTLMVSDHHGRKVRIDIAGRLHRHVLHHLAHGGLVLGHEGRLRVLLGLSGFVGRGRLLRRGVTGIGQDQQRNG